MLLAALALIAAPAPLKLSRAEINAAFRAGGFRHNGHGWRTDCLDLREPGFQSGRIERVTDLNGDGRPEAVIAEGSPLCFGIAARHFIIVSMQRDRRWRRVAGLDGIERFLAFRGPDGWPDIELDYPGLCTPVYRWDGRAYRLRYFNRRSGPKCPLPDPK
jgi:hypothetical protein